MTAVIVNVNRAYGITAGLRLTGFPVIRILPVEGLPEIREGEDLAELIAARAGLEDRDVLVVAAEGGLEGRGPGRARWRRSSRPTRRGELAGDEDPRRLEVILREAKRIVRTRPPLVIAETRHGFVCASAGVDCLERARAGDASCSCPRTPTPRRRASASGCASWPAPRSA